MAPYCMIDQDCLIDIGVVGSAVVQVAELGVDQSGCCWIVAVRTTLFSGAVINRETTISKPRISIEPERGGPHIAGPYMNIIRKDSILTTSKIKKNNKSSVLQPLIKYTAIVISTLHSNKHETAAAS